MYQTSERKNFELLQKAIMKKRELAGKNQASTQFISHPLVGKHLIEKSTGKVYLVEKAMKHWMWGYYVALLIQCNGSHAQIFWENITSDDSIIIAGIKRSHDRFAVQEG